jgi:hypothetical protein
MGAAPLTGVTAVNGRVQLCSNPGVVVTLPGTIVSAPEAIVSLVLSSWLPNAEVGPWELTWHPEYQSGARPIWPEDGYDRIHVHP